MLSKIQNLLYSCYEENTTDKLPDIKFQLFLISVKSLMPYEDKIGCSFDLTRYKKEIDLLSLYKNGQDDSLDYYFKNKKPWDGEDILLEYKILPAAISNTVWENLIEEVMKTAAFFSVNKNTFLNAILVSSAIYDYLNDESIDFDNMNLKARERVIQFSIKEFSENNNINLNKNQIIEFEKERIKTISKIQLYSEDYILKFKSLQHIFSKVPFVKEDYNDELLSNYASYLMKLRKGTINPEKLRITETRIPELKEFFKSPVFSHPLIGRCKIVKKTEKEVILKNKTGLMKVNI